MTLKSMYTYEKLVSRFNFLVPFMSTELRFSNAFTLLFPLNQSDGVTTRGHCLKLQKRDCNTCVRANFLGLRIVNFWNNLPEYVVTADSCQRFQEPYGQTLPPSTSLHYHRWSVEDLIQISQKAYGLAVTEEDDDDDEQQTRLTLRFTSRCRCMGHHWFT